MKRLCVTIPLLGLALLLGSCGQSPEEKMASLWETAHDQLNNFQFEEARLTFDQVATERPDDPIDMFSEALILEHQFQFWNAMPDYMSLVDQQPNFEPARKGLWRTLDWNGYTIDAIRAASEWFAAFPSSQDAAMALTQSLIHDGQHDRARRIVDSAVVLGLNPATASMIKAYSYRLEYQFDTAASYATGQNQYPADDPQWYRWAAEYYEADQQYDSALVLTKKAWELADGGWEHWWYHYHRLLRLDDRLAARRMIATFEAAERPEYITAWLQMQYLSAIGEHHQAKRSGVMYTKMLQQDFSTLRTDLILTRNAHDQISAEGNADVMIGLLEARTLPEQFEDLMMFDLLYELKDTRPALDYFRKLDQVPSQYRDAHGFQVTSLRHLHSTGQLDAFAERRAEVLKEHRDDPRWMTDLGDILSSSPIAEYDRAYERYLDALEADPWYYQALEHNVNMLLEQERAEEAAKLFELYPYFVDSLPQAAVLKARTMIHNGQVEPAMALVESNIEPIRMVVENYHKLNDALLASLNRDARSQLVSTIETVAPENPDVMAVAAEIALEGEEWDRAIELADKSLALDPNLLSPAVTKAWATFKKGQKAEAFEMFVDNAVAGRNDMRNNMYYSRALAIEGREATRAGNLARMAVFESFGSLEARLNLSFVYYNLGRFDLSYGEALKASSIAPESPLVWFRVGVAQYERGQGEAIANLEKAIALGLEGEELKTAQRILGG